MADHVQAPLVEGQHLAGRTLLAETGAAQQGLDARQQLARAERLAQVVVGAQLQADHPVGLVGAGGEHDHRHRGEALVLAHPAAQAETVLVGQHHIENHQVRRLRGHGRAEPRAVADRAHLETGAAQVCLQQFANLLVVVDQEDGSCGLAHFGLPYCSVAHSNQCNSGRSSSACCSATPAPSRPGYSAVTSHTGMPSR
ncbi:hypothetical protein D3C84_481310 [compost metagenome]